MALFDPADFGTAGSGLFDFLSSLAPQQPPYGPQQPQQQPQPQGPGIGDRLGAGLMGFAHGSAPLPAIANLFGGLATGQRQDEYGIAQQQQATLQRAAVNYAANAEGIPPEMKQALMQSPAMAVKFMAERLKPAEYKFEKAGQYYGAFDPRSGNYRVQGAVPEFQKVEPGQTGSYVSPATPGMGPTSTPVLSGGPEKPPAGYDWKDPKNPSAGLVAIAGGPATKLEGNTAGYLAMLEGSRPGVEQAKKFFLSPDFKSGPIDAAGLALGQKLDVGEISRQRRNIEMATEAAIRMATGATAPPDEVKRYANFYMPSVYDGEPTRRQKLDALTRFMDYAQANIGRGRMPEPDKFMGANSPTGPGLPGFNPTKPGAGWSAQRL